MIKLTAYFILVILLTSSLFSSMKIVSAEEVEFIKSSSSVQSTIALQHSLDGGKTWIERGRIDPESLEFQPSETTGKWTKDQLDQLRSLALKKGTTTSVAQSSIIVRVIDVASSDVHTSLVVSPCSLVVPRQYTTQLTYIAERYGVTFGKNDCASCSSSASSSPSSPIRINSLRLMNPFHDEVCEPTVFKTRDENTEVKLKISFVKSPQLKNVGFPYGSASGASIEDTGANLHDGAAGRGGRGGSVNSKSSSSSSENKDAPAEEKSFWEKYGTYIMIFLVVQSIGGLFGGKEEKQKGGAAPGGAGGKQKGE